MCYSLRRISCPRVSPRLTKCEERLLGFGYLRTKSCTSALFPGYIYYAYTLRYQSCSWKSYMKGSMGATQEANLCLTEPSLRDIGGQTYRRKVQKYVKKCDQCQKFTPNIHKPEGVLNPLSRPWPFAQWGLDIVGLFPKVAGNKRWLLVFTNYFTKWVEVEPLANIRDLDAKRFVWKNIVTWFGIPHTLISNNDLQFDSKAFRRYCCDLGIMNRYSTLAYP